MTLPPTNYLVTKGLTPQILSTTSELPQPNSRGAGLSSGVKSARTHEAGEPTPPGGLVAQTYGPTAIKLCWFEQNVVDPLTGDDILDETSSPSSATRLPILDGADGKTEMTLVENTVLQRHSIHSHEPEARY